MAIFNSYVWHNQRVLIAQQRSMFPLIFGREASLSMVRGWAKFKRMLDRYHESKPLSGFSHLQTDELWSLTLWNGITMLVGGIPTPLKNDGVRQLGWFSIPNCFWKVIIHSCSSQHQLPVSKNPRCDGPLHQGRHLLRMCRRPAVGEGDDDLRQQRLGRSCGETVLGGFVGGKTGRPLEEPLEEQ